MNLENIMLSGLLSQTQKTMYCIFHLLKKSRIGKAIETKSKLVIAWAVGEKRNGEEVSANQYRISLGVIMTF